MKLNTGKIHLLVSGNAKATAKIDSNCIECKKEQVLLGITIDSNLVFKNHINYVCKRASKKLNALTRVALYMNMQKKRIIMKSFITTRFGYCPLIWMFHSRRLNNKINSIHKRVLRITYQDHISAFQKLLHKDNSVSVHHRNLQTLATGMFKIPWGLSPYVLIEILVPKISLSNLRRNNTFERRQLHSVYRSSELLFFLCP